jgi:hypothetical protein
MPVAVSRAFFAAVDITPPYLVLTDFREFRSVFVRLCEPVRSYLRTLRDVQWFHHLSFPDDDNELLEWASIQLAEKISRGMAECTPTFSRVPAWKKDGEKARGIREFAFGNDPGSLVGAANYQLASLVSRKKVVRDCEECGEMFVPEDPRQRYHKKCGACKRQRESRQKRKAT